MDSVENQPPTKTCDRLKRWDRIKKCDKLSSFCSSTYLFGAGLVVSGGIYVALRKFNVFSRLFYSVDTKTTQHGGDVVATVLKNHGVNSIFTLVGGHISPILVAAEKQGIRVIDTRHEVSAVFAADAVARLSGKIGVVAVTGGPGLTNTITAVKNAQMAESPVLLIGGAAATLLKGKGALQDIDQMSLFKPLCKFCATVPNVRSIGPTLQKAIQISQSGTPGPVFVEFPIDVLYPYHITKRELGLKPPKTLTQRLTNLYIENHIHNVYANGFKNVSTTPLPVSIPKASNNHIDKALKLLKTAKRPLVLVGSQSTLAPTAPEEIQAALNKLGIPCFLGGMARGLLGKSSPLQMRQRRKEALKDADLVILAGAICDFRLGYGRTLNPKSKIIAVNRNKEQLYKNAGIFWNPTLAIQADVGSFITSLASQAEGNIDPEWVKLLRDRDNEKEKQNEKMATEETTEHQNPLKVLQELEKILPDNAILVADGGDFVATAAYTLRPRAPLTWLDPGAFGTLGVGGGFALGAKVVHPESEVVIIYGDGSLGYSIMEYDTFVRHKLPVWSVVGNDACWTQISRDQVTILGSNVACELKFSDYHKAVEGIGGKGILITDKDNVSEALTKARALHSQGESVLVNVLIGKSKFREGSMSV